MSGVREILREFGIPLKTIADKTNFEDTSYRCRFFKKHFTFGIPL